MVPRDLLIAGSVEDEPTLAYHGATQRRFGQVADHFPTGLFDGAKDISGNGGRPHLEALNADEGHCRSA